MSVDGIEQTEELTTLATDTLLHEENSGAELVPEKALNDPESDTHTSSSTSQPPHKANFAQEGKEFKAFGMRYSIQSWRTGFPLLLADLGALTFTIAFLRTVFFKFGYPIGIDVSQCLLPISTGFMLISAELGLYPGIRLSPVEEFRRVAVAVTGTFAMWSIGVALLLGSVATQSWFLLFTYLCSLLIVPIVRGWARRVLATGSWWGFPAIICGDDSVAVNLHHWLKTNRRLGLRPVGVIADPNGLEIDSDAEWYAGSWSDAKRVALDNHAFWAVVVPPEAGGDSLADSISNHLNTIPHIHVVSELTGLPDHWNRHQKADGLSGIHLQQNLLLPGPRMVKRGIDLVATLIGGFFLLPLLVFLAIGIKLTSKGPIFYGHERIGRNKKRFKAWKFRTMVVDADRTLEKYLEAHPELRAEWEKDHKLRDDPRITSIGKFIRKLSLDELPQLWNVIRGDMSLVGPRPIVTDEVEKYGDSFHHYTFVLPGITGLWQVSGRNDTSYEERVKLDTYYVRNWSPWMDVYLLMKTIKIVLFAEGAY